MKKFLFSLLFFLLFAFKPNVTAQCELPELYSGSPGSNMTVFFTSGAISALPISTDSPYIVAISPDGLIVGSASVASVDLIGGQQSLAVWGDDTITPELDGAQSGDEITFQLVDGNSLYDLDLSFAGLNSYVTNGQLPVIAGSAELNCTAILGCTDPQTININGSEILLDCNGQIPQPSNTGANMTIGVFVSKFDQFADGGQIGAFYDLNGDGTLECVGVETIQEGFFGLALWGDDSPFPECDHCIYSGEAPQFAILHEGNVIMVDEIPQFTGYVTNGIVNMTDANLSIDQPGCNDPNACNFYSLYQDVTYVGGNNCIYTQYTFLGCNGFIPNINTGVNMTVGLNSSDFDQFIGGQFGALYDLNNNGVLNNVTYPTQITYGFMGLALWGDDLSTPEQDGLYSGAVPQFAIFYEGQLIYMQETPEFSGYVTNGIKNITGSDFYSDECVDPNACNYFSTQFDNVNYSNANCSYSGCLDESYLEFNSSAGCSSPNMCLTPLVYGCTDSLAFNYNAEANTNDGSCYPVIEGCMDPNANNYVLPSGNVQIDINTSNSSLCAYSILLDAFDFEYPVNTGNNMSVGFTLESGLHNSDGQIAAFYDYDYDGLLECVGISNIQSGFTGIGIWGDDQMTPEPDGLESGDIVTFMIINENGFIPINIEPEYTGYNQNSIHIINQINPNYYGCTDINYCNFSPLAQENWENYCSGTAACSDDNYIEYNPDAECYEDQLCLTTLQDHIDNLNDTINLYRDAFVGCQNNQIFIDLLEGWNIIGYTHTEQNDAVTALEEIQDILFIIKNNEANFYMPEYGFNGIGDLIPGQGYQIKTSTSYSQFTFDEFISIPGCIFEWADNYNELATIDNGLCYRMGCMSDWADNFDELATINNGTCELLGCTETWADNYDSLATINDYSCFRYGCTDFFAVNFDPFATEDDGSCWYDWCYDPWCPGCHVCWPPNCPECYLDLDGSSDLNYDEFDESQIIYGCTNPDALNYNPDANSYDGSCTYPIQGCMNVNAINYNPEADIDDGSCYDFIFGCTDTNSINYNPAANTDDGSCI